MLLIFSFIFSITLISFSLYRRSVRSSNKIKNEELDAFYDMFTESPALQMKQLISAAKTTLKNFTIVNNEREVITELFEDNVISDRFFRRFKDMEDDLIFEKTLIENEAEALKPGSRDQIFYEANKISNIEGEKKKKIFDEALFLKKQERLNSLNGSIK